MRQKCFSVILDMILCWSIKIILFDKKFGGLALLYFVSHFVPRKFRAKVLFDNLSRAFNSYHKKKRLLYENNSIFHGEYDGARLK